MALGFMDRIRQQWQKKDVWPPADVKDRWNDIEAYRRRYNNDRRDMIQANPNIAINAHKIEIYTPVPWPREMCRFSSALLFSETPRVTIKGTDDAPELEPLLRVNDFGAFAIRGGVKAACEGRVGIRVIRDTAVDATTPLLTLIPEDQVIWDVRHGHFYVGGMVVITRKVTENGRDVVYRLLEQHSAGLVKRTLYKGTEHTLGKQTNLGDVDEFSSLVPEENTGLDSPTLIPWENVPGGESDLFGMGPVFDEINEAESLLLDRIRKGIPRTFVDHSLADETGRLDIDGYILTGGARMRPPLGATADSMVTTVAPDLQLRDHVATVDHIQQLMVTVAGYSPLTWGIQGQTATVARAVSGYAMKLAQLRTLLNRSQKEHMALQALGWGVGVALAWNDTKAATKTVAEYLPSIQLGDGLPSDALDGAQEVLYLRQALAASTETLVKTIHPTWSDGEIDAEVQLIMDQGSFPGAGPALGLGNLPKHIRDLLKDDGDDRAGGGIDPAPGAV